MRLIDADSLLVNMQNGIQGTAREYLKFYQMVVNDEPTADTIEFLSAKLQAANMEQQDPRLDNGWIYCDEWLPSTVEYMELEPSPHMKRLEIAYMTDTVEYLIGYYDGSKWMDKHHNIIKNVLAWRKFLPLPEKRHEP